jgi:hypothetical protein
MRIRLAQDLIFCCSAEGSELTLLRCEAKPLTFSREAPGARKRLVRLPGAGAWFSGRFLSRKWLQLERIFEFGEDFTHSL